MTAFSENSTVRERFLGLDALANTIPSKVAAIKEPTKV
jgi:hypothetical protein